MLSEAVDSYRRYLIWGAGRGDVRAKKELELLDGPIPATSPEMEQLLRKIQRFYAGEGVVVTDEELGLGLARELDVDDIDRGDRGGDRKKTERSSE